MRFDSHSTLDPGLGVHEYAAIFRALASPARFAVFQAVRGGGCVRDIARRLGLSAPLVSHHLRELRLAGLVRTARRGRRVECSVDAEALGILRRFVSEAAGAGPPGGDERQPSGGARSPGEDGS